MIYVMSDIHGQYKTFLKMLKKINFSQNDELYILGDVIDRGPESVKILEYILDKENIHFILGNHEDMFIESYYCDFSTYMPCTRMWFMNGGLATFPDIKDMEKEKLSKIIKYLEDSPIYIELEVNGQKFFLSHAGYDKDLDRHELIWNRYPFEVRVPEDTIAIFGHTGTYHYNSKTPYELEEYKNLIDIDCGLARQNPTKSRLCCLCLNNMNEFYVKIQL
jgi:serine/threonine protein phosphatase 1